VTVILVSKIEKNIWNTYTKRMWCPTKSTVGWRNARDNIILADTYAAAYNTATTARCKSNETIIVLSETRRGGNSRIEEFDLGTLYIMYGHYNITYNHRKPSVTMDVYTEIFKPVLKKLAPSPFFVNDFDSYYVAIYDIIIYLWL